MKLKLINLGRDNVNKEIDLKKPSYSTILKEVKKYILAKNPDIEETDHPNIYDVFSGVRRVGQIWVEKPEYMILL